MTLSKSAPRRQRLIEIGLELFSSHMYDMVSIDNIAAAADVSKGLLYYYFPTKRDFYVAVVEYAAERLLAVTASDEALPPLARLRIGLDAYFRYVEQYARIYIALLRGVTGMNNQVATIVDAVRQQYTQRILQGSLASEQAAPLLRVAMNGWFGFVEALSLAWLEERSIDRAALCDLAITMLTTLLKDTHIAVLSA